MFARNVTFSIKPNMSKEVTAKFEKDVLPILRKTVGFKDHITMTRGDNEIVGISLWDKREQIDTYTRDTDPQVIKLLESLVNANPDVRIFEVSSFSSHKFVASA